MLNIRDYIAGWYGADENSMYHVPMFLCVTILSNRKGKTDNFKKHEKDELMKSVEENFYRRHNGWELDGNYEKIFNFVTNRLNKLVIHQTLRPGFLLVNFLFEIIQRALKFKLMFQYEQLLQSVHFLYDIL